MTTHVGPCKQSRCKVQEGDPSESPNISLRPPSFRRSQLYSSTDVLTQSHACFHSHIYSPLTPKEPQSLYQSVWAELCLSNKHPQILTQHGSRGFTHTYSISLTHIYTLPHPLTHSDTQTLYQSVWAGLCCSNKRPPTSELCSVKDLFVSCSYSVSITAGLGLCSIPSSLLPG